MPTYELALVMRQMSRPELVAALKRCATTMFDKGCVIRKVENLGSRALPHKISEHGLVHREATYFNFTFDVGPTKLQDLREEFGRDIDVVRRNIYKVEEPEQYECTLHEELLPPAYRKDVQQMVEAAKRKQKPKYNYNSGIEYYPFQK